MHKIIIALIIINSNWSFSQDHGSLFEAKTIKQNSVNKIVHYNPEDSIDFFEKYPEGFYSKYDKFGRLIESNGYSSFESAGVWYANMFTNYYLYDSLDNRTAFVQIDHGSEIPFRFLTLSSFSNSDTIKTARLKDSYQVNSTIVFEEKPKEVNTQFWHDTIKISKKHLYLRAISDSTITIDIYLNERDLKDSTVLKSIGRGMEGEYKSEISTNYDYFENGNVKTIRVERFRIKKSRELISIAEYYYFENELLDKIRTYYTLNDTWNVNKFKYFKRNESIPIKNTQ